jgi:PAPA-1-like conserved region
MSGRVQVRERRWVLSSHVSLGGLMFLILSRLIIWSIDETSRKKKQLNEGEIALRREETARKRKHLYKKNLEDEKVRVSHSHILLSLYCLVPGGDDQLTPEEEESGTRNRRTSSPVRKIVHRQLTLGTVRHLRRARSTRNRAPRRQR